MSSLAQMIGLVSKGEYTYGPGCKYSTSDLSLLESSTAGTVNRLNTPGFSGDELLLFKTYIILDLLTGGTGQIVEKTIKDASWKLQSSKSSSGWMDKALAMIAYSKNGIAISISFTGVERSDAVMERLWLDNTGYPQYGNPNKEEWED